MNALRLSSLLLLLVVGTATAADHLSASFWNEIAFLRNCVAFPVYSDGEGRQHAGRLLSRCPEIRVLDATHARLTLSGATFEATLSDSRESDGGDLNDVIVRDAAGNVVAQRGNVPAFGDILLGLLGGNAQGLRIIEASANIATPITLSRYPALSSYLDQIRISARDGGAIEFFDVRERNFRVVPDYSRCKAKTAQDLERFVLDAGKNYGEPHSLRLTQVQMELHRWAAQSKRYWLCQSARTVSRSTELIYTFISDTLPYQVEFEVGYEE